MTSPPAPAAPGSADPPGRLRRRRGTHGTVAVLALADLRHEWLLNLCIVLALAAILAPLLLLFGLKNGVITILRARLVEDPVYREVKPAETLNLSQAWFDALAARPEVAFVVPTILRGSSVVRVAAPGEDAASRALDLIPTAPGDPLFTDNDAQIPGPGAVALSAVAAEELGVAAGDQVELVVTRSRGGRPERETLTVPVADVLPAKADGLERVYAPLALVRDVEAYREGRAVPDRGWPGGLATATPVVDGAFVLVARPLDPVTRHTLAIGTGFTDVEPVSADAMRAVLGTAPRDDVTIYRVSVFKDPVGPSSVAALRRQLRGRGAAVLPYVADASLRLDGRAVSVNGYSVAPETAQRFGLPAAPWGGDGGFGRDADRTAATADGIPALVPGAGAAATVRARIPSMQGEPVVPLAVAGAAPGDAVLVPAAVAGTIRAGAARRIAYAPEAGRFLLSRSPYRGFRLYARSIDDVAGLFAELRGQGFEVITQVAAIERIRVLDRGLTNVFWLIAVVGIVGGIAALIASLYAAVERKTRELSMMRLMGVPRASVFWFPLVQSAAIAVLCGAVAASAYAALASVINGVFATDIGLYQGSGGRICDLPPDTLAAALAATVAAALLAALAAAWKTTRIEPGEAIRVE